MALGLAAGLGLANNLTVGLLAPIGLWGVIRGAREAKVWGRPLAGAAAAFAVGLLPYAYLLVAPEAASFGTVDSLGELVDFMTSGPCMPMVLEKADAVAALRTAIGATDPAQADEGTVRKLYAESKGRNAIHASDSDENAARESRFFFADTELLAAR